MRKSLRLPTFLCAAAICLLASAGQYARAGEDEAEMARRYQEDMGEGIAIIKSGNKADISRAIAKFKSALKNRPESSDAYYWIAVAYSDQGNFPRAAANAKDATIYDDKFADAWLLWGQILLFQKDWEQALEKLDTAARLDPENPLVQFNLGRVYYHGFNNPDSALAKFRSVWQRSQTLRNERPELLPTLMQARLYMGYCEYDRGRWDNAINAFRDVLIEYRNHYEAALRLALAYKNSGRVAECERILQNMLKVMDPARPENHRILADVHLQLAKIYLSDPALRNRMFALTHLRAFVNMAPEGHAMMTPAREYLATHEFTDS